MEDETTVHWIYLIAGILVLSFTGMGNHGLFEPDEGRYASMALEWTELQEHDPLEPTLSDVGHYDKPPLIYWLTGISLITFGNNEFAARLPSTIGGFLTLLGVGILGFRLYSERHAKLAVVICATTIQFWALSHLLSPDMLSCGLCTMGAALTLSPTENTSSRKKTLLWLIGVLFWILAWWTKATATLVPLISLTAALYLTKERDLLKALKPVRLAVLILLGGLPWYLIMVNRHPELWDFFLHRELVGRVVGHDDRKGFFGYHFAVAMGFWLPWWPIALAHSISIVKNVKNSPLLTRMRSLPWELWCALCVVAVYSLISSRLITYIIPAVPYLALATAGLLLRTEQNLRIIYKKIVPAAAVTLLIISFGIPIYESRIGSNSSLRKPIEELKRLGADVILLDRHRPGAEFYFGEAVCYIDCRSIQQVDDAKGQNAGLHFVTFEEVRKRYQNFAGTVWCIKTRKSESPWMSEIHDPQDDVVIGDFTLFPVKF